MNMKIKKVALITSLLVINSTTWAWACTVCKSNQPKGLENITHGEGPSGVVDLVIMWTAIVIVVITLFLSIKYLVKPGEYHSDHIKNFVIHEND